MVRILDMARMVGKREGRVPISLYMSFVVFVVSS